MSERTHDEGGPLVSDPAIGLYFKPVPGGFIFRAPKDSLFANPQHFLVSNAQREAIRAILKPPQSGNVKPTRIVLILTVTVVGILALAGLIYLMSNTLGLNDSISALVGIVLAIPFTVMGLMAFVSRQGRQNLIRLKPVLDAAQQTDQTISNLVIMAAARAYNQSRGSVKYSWGLAVIFSVVSLTQIMALVFDYNPSVPFLADAKVIMPMIQVILFAVLAAISFQAALDKIKSPQIALRHPSDGKATFFARNMRQIILGTEIGFIALAVLATIVALFSHDVAPQALMAATMA